MNMDQMAWGLSESSESDSDDERPITKFKTNSLFYSHFKNGEYGPNWPDDLSAYPNQHHVLNNSIVDGATNATEDDSILADVSRISDANESRILSPGQILNSSSDFVLVREGDKFRPVRVVTDSNLLIPRRTPDAKFKKEPSFEPVPEPHHVPIIPLEQVDFIDAPIDPRKTAIDYCYCSEDSLELELNKLWHDEVFTPLFRKNLEQNAQSNGRFKRSLPYVRDKTLNSLMQRITEASKYAKPKLQDPRLKNRSSLFGPPQKLPNEHSKSPSKSHNRSQPNIKISASKSKSIFGDSNDISSDSSSSESSADEKHFENHNSTQQNHSWDSSSDSDDGDCSFMSFNNKRKITSKDQRLVKKRKLNESHESNDKSKHQLFPVNNDTTPKNLLLKQPPTIDPSFADEIMSSLAYDTAEEDQENENTNSDNINKTVNKTKNVTTKDKKNVPKAQTKSKPKPKAKSQPTKTKNAPKQRKRQTITPVGKVVSPEKTGDNSPDSTINNKTDVEMKYEAIAKASVEQPFSNSSNLILEQELVVNIPTENLSDDSSSSTNSIERQLAQIVSCQTTSPIKRVVGECNESTGEILSDILTITNGVVVSRQSSGNEEPSPPFEEIISTIPINSGSDNQMPDISSTAPDAVNVIMTQLSNCSDNTQNVTATETITNGISRSTDEQGYGDQQYEVLGASLNQSIDYSLGVPEIGATQIYPSEDINIDEYTKDLYTSSLDDIGKLVEPKKLNETTQSVDHAGKLKRARIIINDYLEGNVNTLSFFKIDRDIETSDDDFEDDIPCEMDEFTLPNSNTDRNLAEKLTSNCHICAYTATKSWKHLTKHYVRKHPCEEISISRLAKQYNPQNLMVNPLDPIITQGIGEIMIRSLCYICNKGYDMCSSKWLMHFVAHTGEYEFRCKKCYKAIAQDLHKKCSSKDNTRINGPHDFNDNALYGFVCALCNYVQLSKNNVIYHLEQHHQQIFSEENVIEIILLKISQPLDFLMDDKNDENLREAVRRHSVIQKATRFDNAEILSDDENDVKATEEIEEIDLTQTDDEE